MGVGVMGGVQAYPRGAPLRGRGKGDGFGGGECFGGMDSCLRRNDGGGWG